jgi:hypothetical protein
MNIPLRLFDNLGLLTPAVLFEVVPVEDLAGPVGVERFEVGLAGAVREELLTDGVSRIAEGEGILISSIPML